MNILCTICSDLVIQTENIYVTPCGHIFHHHCLAQWIARSKTCPQCRNKVTDQCMFRIYPTVSKESGGVNAATWQSRHDKAQLKLRLVRAKLKEREDRLEAISDGFKMQEQIFIEMVNKNQREIDSHVKALREELLLQTGETQYLKEENEVYKDTIRILYKTLFLTQSKENKVKDKLVTTNLQLNMTNQQFALKIKSACNQQDKINVFLLIIFICCLSYILYKWTSQ